MTSKKITMISWNINSGVYENSSLPAPHQQTAQYVGKSIKILQADIIGVQECVLSGINWNANYLDKIQKESGLNYSVYVNLSPSHVVNGANMGLAIISRYPIRNSQELIFKTPDLMVTGIDGKTGALHQKGLLTAIINADGLDLYCVCGHLPPFRLISEPQSSPLFEEMWRLLDKTLVHARSLPTVGLVDCNTSDTSSLLPTLATDPTFKRTIHQATRPTGEQHDQIFLSHHWMDISSKVIPSKFDHHLCFAQAHLGNPRGRRSTSRTPRPELKPITILHLSDLHFGDGSRDDVDWKVYVEHTTRERRRDRMVETIIALQRRIDYVVVSGDLTIAGGKLGFEEFSSTVDDLISAGKVTGVDRVIVVPGNHDVTRKIGNAPANSVERWQLFSDFTTRFVRPLLPTDKHSAHDVIKHIRTQIADASSVIGGTWESYDHSLGRRLKYGAPLLLDREDKILFYTFNSASVSGTRTKLSDDVESAISTLKLKGSKKGSDIDTILKALEKELWVDPSRVDPKEFNLFNEIISMLNDDLKDFCEYTRVAVLHHHVVPVVPEEVTKFEILTNAGRFAYEIARASFDLILHGHKHWPGVHFQVWADETRSQVIVSGGTIGGYEGTGTEPGFHLIELEWDRSNVKTNFIPVLSAGDPRAAVKEAMRSGRKIKIGTNSSLIYRPERQFSLRPIFGKTQHALLAYARQQNLEDGRILHGWSHQLDEDRVSIIATAYGLMILDLIEAVGEEAHTAVSNAISTLRALRNSDGGWSASSQNLGSRPEATAFVLSALSKWLPPEAIKDELTALERLLSQDNDSAMENSTFLNARIAQVLADVHPSSESLRVLANRLRASSFRDENGFLRWWASNMFLSAVPAVGALTIESSPLHTSHAIIAMCKLGISTGGRLGCRRSELSAARDWLLNCREWDNCAETINRVQSDGKYEQLVIKHYSAAWALIAVLMVGERPDTNRVLSETERLLSTQNDGLWDWSGVKRPIWATYDALLALKEFAMAKSTV